MKFLRYLHAHSPQIFWKLIGWGFLAGISNTVFVGLFNHGINLGGEAVWSLLLALVFLAALAFSEEIYFKVAAVLLHGAAQSLETRIIEDVRSNALPKLEKEGLDNTAGQINESTQIFLESSVYSVIFLLKGVMQSICVTAYLWVISGGVFMAILAWIALLSPYFYQLSVSVTKAEATIYPTRNALREAFNDMQKGYYQLKMNKKKRASFLGHFEKLTEDSLAALAGTSVAKRVEGMQAQSFMMLFLGIFSFIGPYFADIQTVHYDLGLLVFLLRPVENFLYSINDWKTTETELAEFADLQSRFSSPEHGLPAETVQSMDFRQHIVLTNVEFRYPDSKKAKPALFIDRLEIPKGQIIFVTGGNGSGKSTLLMLLAGLYAVQSGQVSVDGKPVTPISSQPYRELFSAVFTDFHVHTRMLEGEGIPDERVAYLLDLLGLADKISYSNGLFSEINLSSGQKKRLAMLAAFLENKPIYIFDELAADQDPENRRFFYEVILPDLKKNNKTVVAVTHDDRYFSAADMRIDMEGGTIKTIERG